MILGSFFLLQSPQLAENCAKQKTHREKTKTENGKTERSWVGPTLQVHSQLFIVELKTCRTDTFSDQSGESKEGSLLKKLRDVTSTYVYVLARANSSGFLNTQLNSQLATVRSAITCAVRVLNFQKSRVLWSMCVDSTLKYAHALDRAHRRRMNKQCLSRPLLVTGKG